MIPKPLLQAIVSLALMVFIPLLFLYLITIPNRFM